LDEENPAPALDEEEDVDPDAPAAPADPQAEAPEHQLVKKYGGFMKRYGGFMARRAPPASVLMQGAPEEAGGPGRGEGRGEDGEQQEQEEEEEENIRLEILKILNAEAEGRAAHGAEAEGRAAHGAEAKRYGGFMRRAGLQADPLEAVLGRALKKRYGGFMRRVGRPEWLVDDSNKSGNGVLKRAWEDGRELQKRYGGFMD
jgi:proenkephalin A